MSSNINRYIYDKSNSFRLSKDLEKAILQINDYTYYLDVEKQFMHIIGGGEFESQTILRGSGYFLSLPIQNCSVVGLEILNENLLRYYAHDQRVVKVENNVILFQIVGEGLKRLKEIIEMKIRKEKMTTTNCLFMVETGKFNILLPKKKRF